MVMKTVLIALLALSLILSAGRIGLFETAPGNASHVVAPGRASAALEYSKAWPIQKAADHPSVRWYERKNNTKRKGVALVIHGLNCRPNKMESIIAQMTEAGIDCLNLSLRGHGRNDARFSNTEGDEARMEAFKSVTYPLWKNEAYQAYQRVETKSRLYDSPLFFIGFSMGGLLGVDLFASNPKVKFDRMVLFAPAVKMRARNFILKILSPFPGLVIPSAPGHTAYLANRGTPMAAYNALFDMYRHLEDNPDPKINVPTLVFIDEQDELISFSGLKNMIRDQKLDQWRIHPVIKDKTATAVKMHHLIIDEASVGNNMWQEMVRLTIAHLSADAQSAGPGE